MRSEKDHRLDVKLFYLFVGGQLSRFLGYRRKFIMLGTKFVK